MGLSKLTPLLRVLVLLVASLSACAKKNSSELSGTTTVHQAGSSSTRPLLTLLDDLDLLSALETAPTPQFKSENEKTHYSRIKSLLKDVQSTKEVRTQALAELELEAVLAETTLLGTVEEISSLKKELAQLLGSLMPRSYDGIKLALEEKIEAKLGTKILYNKDATDPLAMYLTGKMESTSGTELFNLARLYALPTELNAVWIYRPGHVLPGVVHALGERLELEGIEITALGVALIRYGAIANLDEPLRIVHADLATLLDLVKPYISDETHKKLAEQALRNTARYYQIPIECLNETVEQEIEASIRLLSTDSEQTKIDETKFPNSFGSRKIPSGDQERIKIRSRRNGQNRSLNRNRNNPGSPSVEASYPHVATEIPQEGKWALVGLKEFPAMQANRIKAPAKILGDGRSTKETNVQILTIDSSKVCFAHSSTQQTLCLELNGSTGLFELHIEGAAPLEVLATYTLRVAD
jgi:hypothetical protein